MVVCGMVLGGIKLSDTQPFHTQPLHTHYLINYTTAFKNSVIFFLQEIIFTKEAKSFPAGTKKNMFQLEIILLPLCVFFVVVYGCVWECFGWN